MPFLKFLLGLGLAVVVHALALRVAPELSPAFDLFVVVVVLQSLSRSSLAGLAAGLVVGMVQDALTGGLFGLYGFADTIIGYAVARASQRLVLEKAGGMFPVAATAAVVQQAIVVGLAYLLLPDPRFPDLGWLALRAASAGLVATTVYAAGGWGRGWSEQRRLRHKEKLHL